MACELRLSKEKFIYPYYMKFTRAILILTFAAMAFANSFVNDFLTMDSDIRSSAMGGCPFVARGASGVFNNPATVGTGDFLFFGHEQRYNGLLISDAAGIELNISSPGDFAVGVLYTGGSGINTTELPDPSAPISATNRPYSTGEESHHDLVLMPAYAMQFGDLRIGASAGFLFRDLVDIRGYGGSASIGADWNAARNLHLGAVISRISYISWGTGTSEFGMPSLEAGGSYGFDIGAGFAATLCAGGSYSLQEELMEGSAGLELAYRDLFSLRGGISDRHFTAGADLRIIDGFCAGAALSIQEDLPISYRIGLSMTRRGDSALDPTE